MTRNFRKLIYPTAAALALLLAAGLAPDARTQAAVQFETVALTGDPAPGTEAGVTFKIFWGYFQVTPGGNVAFNAFLEGPGVTDSNNTGHWVRSDGILSLFTREGDRVPVPGLEGDVDLFGVTVFDDQNRAAANAGLTGTGVDSSNDGAVVAKEPDTWRLVIREGDELPDEAGLPIPELNFRGAGGHFLRLGGSQLGPALVGFPTTVERVDGDALALCLEDPNKTYTQCLCENQDNIHQDCNNDNGIWAEKLGSDGTPVLTLGARDGDPAPGTSGAAFRGVTDRFNMNAAGELAFMSALVPENDPRPIGQRESLGTGIWVGLPGAINPVLLPGDPARDEVGDPLPGVTFTGALPFTSLNRHGEVAFRADLTGDGVDASNNTGLWADTGGIDETPGVLRLIVREEDPAPDTEAGVVFLRFYGVWQSGSGDVVFFAKLAGDGIVSGNHQGIWAGDWDRVLQARTLRLVARLGVQAPGTEKGLTFMGFDYITLNGSGQAALRAAIRGPRPNSPNPTGLFAEDPVTGELTLIALTGDDIEVSPGDFRTLERIDLFHYGGTGEDGRNNFVSDLGDIVFKAWFTDGSQGIFVASFVEGGGTLDCDVKGKPPPGCEDGSGGGGKKKK